MIRLLALDIDGTLLDSHWNLSQTNRDALRHAYERGVQIVFVTGRRYQTARPITSLFDFPHFVITTAGAMTRSSIGERLFGHSIPPASAADLLQHIAPFRPWTFLIADASDREELFCEAPAVENRHVARYVELNESCLARVSNLAKATRDPIMEVVLLGHVPEMRDAGRLLDRYPSRHRFKVLRTEYVERDLCLLDIVHGETDKGQAVRRLAESLGFERETVMAIGDNHSDLEMLAYAGHPVVMGNAAKELKSTGWPMTASNDENGVASAIHRYILLD